MDAQKLSSAVPGRAVWWFALLAPAAPLLAQPPAPQAVLRGVVRMDSTGRPLQGVEVLLEGTAHRATTNAAGRFLLSGLPAGRGVLLIRSVGFRPIRQAVTLVALDTVWTEAALVPGNAQELDSLVVKAPEPRGLGVEAFEERRRMGFGKFIDSSVMRRSEHLRVSDVLERAQTGIRMVYIQKDSFHGLHAKHMWAASSRKPGPVFNNASGQCWMQVVVDGVVLYSSANSGPGTSNEPPDFRRDFEVANFHSIEVYRSAAETPIEFGGAGAACGTIVLWSRRR